MRLWTAAALATVTLAAGGTPAASAGGLERSTIVPGKSIGIVALGMTRQTVQRKLKNPIQRSKDGGLYYLAYHYPARDRIGNRGGRLTIVFRGLSRQARAGYMVTVEPSLGTNQGVGVGDTYSDLFAAYGSATCYHSNPDGSRDPEIESNDNYECELARGGGFTYFSFASVDADPGQHIGALAISSRRIDP